MSKKLLSMLLMLCMVLTMLPVSLMAEEAHTNISTRGEIITFVPLDQLQTEKTVTVGTSIDDLELPEILPASVRTNPDTVTDSVYGSEDEGSLVDIPVTWTSQPEYDMDTEGEYIFTPVIEGYTVSAELLEISVTVETAMMRGLVSPMVATEEYDLWVGGVQVTDVNKKGITGEGITGTVTYDSATNTLTLNNAEITNAHTDWFGYDTFCIYSQVSSLTLKLIGENIIEGVDAKKSTYGIRCEGELTIEGGGSLTVTPGRAYITGELGNNHSSGILTEGGLTINDVTLDVWGEQFGLYEYWGGNITINGGTVTAYGSKAAIMVDRGDLKTNGKKVSVMVGDEKPGHEWDASTNLMETYKYVKIELTTDVAQIGETGYATLQGAVNSIAEGDTIQLLADITLTSTVTISSNHNVTIDLNGKTLKNDSNHVINKFGTGKLTITDSGSGGKVECTSTSPYNHLGIFNQGAGEVIIKGGTISAYKMAIASTNGMVSIHGGTISSSSSNAIQSGNTVNVYGGTITSAGGNGLSGITGNIVNVSNGMVENTNGGHAIYGKTVSIYGGTIKNNAEHGNSIGIGYEGISLTLTGGTIENSHSRGTAIYASSTSTITIPSGTVTIKGGGKAMNAAPDLAGYTNVKIMGSTTSADGTYASEITKDDIDTNAEVEAYKYLEFGLATVPGAPTELAATPGDGQLTLTWTAPTSTGGSPITDYEYSINDGTWVSTKSTETSYIVTGLTNGTSYTVKVRAINAIGDGAESAGITSIPAYVPNILTGTAKISNTSPRIGDELTGSLESGNNSGTLTYVWKADGVQVGTGESYTVALTDLGKSIKLEINSNEETGTLASATTAAVLKKMAPIAPDAPTLDAKTYNTVTLTAIENYEFSMNGITWQTYNVFSGLTVGTAYTFYQRVAETHDTEISAASTGFSVTTDSNDGSSSGSDSGGGGSSSDDSSPVIVTPPTPDKPNSPTQGEIKVSGIVDGKGNVTVNITDKTVAAAFDKALEDAKKKGNEQNGITMVLRVDTGSKTGSNVTVNLPKTVQDTIIAKKIVNTIVVVDNPDIRIGMDLATVQEINKQAKSDVNITATRADSSRLTGDAKQAIGSRPVFDLKVNYGSGKQVQSFGAGSVSVTIPYTLGANEKAGNVQAVYVDGNGKVHWLVNSVYDIVEKVLRFSTNHFSTYGIGYKQANTAFTDIGGHWAMEDIEFVVSRGLLVGTSTTTFSPNTEMTRGMFVTALGRLANADVSSTKESSFTDVKNDAYYMGYIEWASKNSIVNGIGNGMFAPDESITREQMAAIMQNYTKVIGFTLPKVHGENTFADSAKTSAYAKDAVKQMQIAGVISGKNGNLFDPQGTATRAEVTAVLRRFMELAISSGTTYTFNQYGVTADVPKT